MTDTPNDLLQRALAATKCGAHAVATESLSQFIARKFSLSVQGLQIRDDTLSLNSINGTFQTADGRKLFFKFHMEESEETVAEYYRAELLESAGYPVETPCYVSREVGEQILIYPFKESERLADMCRRLEHAAGTPEFIALLAGQQALDTLCAERCIETMHTATPSELEQEPLLQLFYWRLVDKDSDGVTAPGGRLKRYYLNSVCTFPEAVQLPYTDLASRTWCINGLCYPLTLATAFSQAQTMLAPEYYQSYTGCTAHGDAHNGNVWANKDTQGGISLSWFDPAFAGTHIPVLLAEVKALFHNIFAHPDWLYDSGEADTDLAVRCSLQPGEILVTHNWSISVLRKEFLDSKRDNFWVPVLSKLKASGDLPADWEAYVRSALFCCPTLVMNLCAGMGSSQNDHTPQTSLLGFSIAIMLGCSPETGSDYVSDFFKEINSLLK